MSIYNPIPNSYQSMENSKNNYNNYQASFSQNTPLIHKQDFSNKNNVLHNNLGDYLQSEFLVEYQILINSVDRNLYTYKDPFNFSTTFGNIQSSTNSFINAFGITVIEPTIFSGPSIDRKFTNIKYINFDYVFLPRTNCVTVLDSNIATFDGSMTHCDHSIDLHVRNKFLILKIEELSSTQKFSTSNIMASNTYMLIPEQPAGVDAWIWKVKSPSSAKIYHSTNLGNISKLTTTIYDEFGNIITLINNDTGLKFDISQYLQPIYKLPTDKALKLNKVMQINYGFTFGIIENDLNTLNKFSR